MTVTTDLDSQASTSHNCGSNQHFAYNIDDFVETCVAITVNEYHLRSSIEMYVYWTSMLTPYTLREA